MANRTVHPFPARMAPSLAMAALDGLTSHDRVLDPMMGSGTVLRHASQLGIPSLGFDLDPLAVLMSSVGTTQVDLSELQLSVDNLLSEARSLFTSDCSLPWIDQDLETTNYVDYWFGLEQQFDLRRIAFTLINMRQKRMYSEPVLNVLRLVLSRIIVTKEKGASLARDVSHSRPHKVSSTSSYSVWEGYMSSYRRVVSVLSTLSFAGKATVALGDARQLAKVESKSVDAVITSPPYLNAIDYMRGHRLALVWLGYDIKELRRVRSLSVGAERSPDQERVGMVRESVLLAMSQSTELSSRHHRMISRYADDVYRVMSEFQRVTKPGGRITLVVGNSMLRGVFISNQGAFTEAARLLGLNLLKLEERELPNQHRYLPMPQSSGSPLGRRMRTETIISLSVPT